MHYCSRELEREEEKRKNTAKPVREICLAGDPEAPWQTEHQSFNGGPSIPCFLLFIFNLIYAISKHSIFISTFLLTLFYKKYYFLTVICYLFCEFEYYSNNS